MIKAIYLWLALMLGFPVHCCWAQSGDGVPLAHAVQKLNEVAQSLDARVTPLTEDELLTAVKRWDRKEQPISDSQYEVFKGLEETKALRSANDLYVTLDWRRDTIVSTTETLTAIVKLDLMTDERRGYTFVVRRQALEQRTYPETAAGYEWIVRPEPLLARNVSHRDFVYAIEIDPKLSVTVSRLIHPTGLYDLQVAVFDKRGQRHKLSGQRIGEIGQTLLSKFELDAQSPALSEIVSLGIEGLSLRGASYLSELAIEKAANAGWKILPLPVTGRPLSFEFVSTSGDTVESSKLLGNVVIIDCWASWCAPCVREIPKLKQLHDEYYVNGLRIIGLSFDEDPKKAKQVYEALGVPWSLVSIPADREARALWMQSARIESLPRILVLDKTGQLRSDTSELPFQLIKSLLNEVGELGEGPEAPTPVPLP
jgi:thiol-disulfide isomerase/thioredoxin